MRASEHCLYSLTEAGASLLQILLVNITSELQACVTSGHARGGYSGCLRKGCGQTLFAFRHLLPELLLFVHLVGNGTTVSARKQAISAYLCAIPLVSVLSERPGELMLPAD